MLNLIQYFISNTTVKNQIVLKELLFAEKGDQKPKEALNFIFVIYFI